ncbi:tripartite motif-containing protein 16-like [Polypterus senegalus]|uniref:tripartite motif-containing protein 16-like n=1 Tax=Polypterus senegalus TaxID=55291 RepID=UPI001966203D|nr:tripartite motif-containing protein 16-like [Polypterus senegalus]
MMAAAEPSVSVDQDTCLVCLEVPKEPVTIPCGHSYCVDCINNYWDKSNTTGVYFCPQCTQIFDGRPELNRKAMSTDLKEVEVRANVAPSQSNIGPGDVPCDVCTGRKRKSSKTCLTCMASYCEAHLQLHRECGAFKRHKLEEPTGNLKDRMCTKHQKVLEIFCRTDESFICLLCAATEHKNHNTVTPDVERTGRQSQLEKKKTEMKRQIQEKEKKLEEMKRTIMRIQCLRQKELQKHKKTFKSVFQALERLWLEVGSLIRDYERREVTKAEDVVERLNREIRELKGTDAELTELSQADDHIHFLKKFSSLCAPPEDEDTTDVTISGDFLPETLKKAFSNLKKNLEEMSGWELVKTIKTGADDASHVLQNLKSRNGLLQHSCPLSLDPSTAHRWLDLSEGNRKVKRHMTETRYPDHSNRFDFCHQVLCREALSGTRFYWEVEWSGEWAEIGVAYKGIGRKGWSHESLLGWNDKSWSLICSTFTFSVWHNNMRTEIRAPQSHRIGVYLDYPAGFLAFYGISDTMTLLHRFKTSFTEPLYPGFGVGWDSSVTICPLNLSDQ